MTPKPPAPSGPEPAATRPRTTPFPPRVLLLTAGAIALRLVLLLGRGDYLAFDEGWYLLLARSLFTGDGYSLIGFPHTALSPLFPALAGALGAAIDSWVWGGRIVAAIAAGLVVLPAWAVFRRLADERVAFIAVILVAVLPSLAPFTVPFWIGADLWVGAEPLLHLFLYTGVALWLRADEGSRNGPDDDAPADRDAPAGHDAPADHDAGPDRDAAAEPGRVARLLPWVGAGAAFGLAFLARPEAIITWGILGLAALGLAAAGRSPRRLSGAALMGVGFLIFAIPYWSYIHDVSGQWSITGRGVALPAVSTGAGAARSDAARTVERMLWEDDEAYRERLYGLDATGLRLRSSYWGVPQQAPGGTTGTTTNPGPRQAAAPAQNATRQTSGPAPGALYIRSMGQILPLLLWLFVFLGAIRPRAPGTARREVPVAGALIGTSIAIAAVVAVDPRTQLFLVPLLALYAARGFAFVEETVQERLPESELRPGFAELVLVAVAVVWLLGINARRLQLSLSLGSPHHIVAEQNRAVAEELDALLDSDGPVASWHPAIAVYADRDWRVLPYAELPGIIRYLHAAGADALVLSAYYPPDLGVEDLGTRYLVLPVPDTEGQRRDWRLRVLQGDTIRALGRLEPASPEMTDGG